MSANASGTVWKTSRAKGGNLLTLLAIADVADEQGRNAWPSPEHLAVKTRMTPRAMRLILHALERDGEIVIQPNVDRRIVRSGYVPPFFFHIRCVFDEAGYALGQPENISETVFARGRRPTGKDFPKRTPSNRKSFPPNRKSDVSESEKTGTAYKEDPSVDPLVEQEQGLTPRPPAQNDEKPEDHYAVIERIVHEVIEPFGDPGEDLPELVKDYIGRLNTERDERSKIRYDSTVIGKAIDSARWQRRNRTRSA